MSASRQDCAVEGSCLRPAGCILVCSTSAHVMQALKTLFMTLEPGMPERRNAGAPGRQARLYQQPGSGEPQQSIMPPEHL